MTKIEALKKSISHWQENVRQLEEWNKKGFWIYRGFALGWYTEPFEYNLFFRAKDCALCLKYFDFFYTSESPCGKCPLEKAGYGCNKYDSIWRKCTIAEGNSQIISSAKEMLKVLRRLKNDE